MNLAEIGHAINKARKDKEITLEQMSKDLNMGVGTLSRLENGKTDGDLGIMKVMRVAEYVGLELSVRPAGFSYTLEEAHQDNLSEPGFKG